MTIHDFASYYKEVHGYEPFPWQVRLAETVYASRRWPGTISLPTSSGKTSLIDIAVFLLALEADIDACDRAAALRTFFVIDRRVVVDEAAEHARGIASALEAARTPTVSAVAQRLKRFGTEVPLRVTALRGGVYRDQTWADAPNQPLICVSTVDQIGSRLLFRGYGLSESQRPVHAGLTGTDSLIILDEAHLSTPFVETVEAVRQFQSRAQRTVVPRLKLVEMSATPNSTGDAFVPDSNDFANLELGKRWSASKLAEILEPASFENDAAKLAQQFMKIPNVRVVGIVVNRIASARAIFMQLPKASSVLLIGRIRPYDRDQLMAKWLPRIQAGRDRASEEPIYVVATQTIEVGANLDFDALITEAAPIDALQQRFGRLDRLGFRGKTSAAIMLRKGTLDGKDPIYGSALDATWRWLNSVAATEDGRRKVEFGILALREKLKSTNSDALRGERQSAPLMFPVHIDTWVQTNPTPDPDPDIAPFLHGADALDSSDVQVVWRADINPGNEDEWEEIIAAAPPVTRETLSVPIGAARRWLEESDPPAVADLEGVRSESDKPGKKLRRCLAWNGPDRIEWDRLYPGATILVPSVYGGCDEDGRWHPESTDPVPDIGDLCTAEAAQQGLRKARLRVHPDVLRPENADEFKARLEVIQKATEAGEDSKELRSELLDWLVEFSQAARDQRSMLADARVAPYPSGSSFVLLSRKQLKKPPGSLWAGLKEMRIEETDEGDSSSLTERFTLVAHTNGVREIARIFAKGIRLSAELIEDLELTAQLHDLGKCDGRFQAFLAGVKVASESELLAKSPGGGVITPKTLKERQKRSGYPKGARHEFSSVALVSQSSALDCAHDRDLVIHLIGTHHGFGRPFVPVWNDPDAPELSIRYNGLMLSANAAPRLHQLDSGWVDRFWSLNERYGAWGLAYLEAIVRRADCVQSRREQEEL